MSRKTKIVFGLSLVFLGLLLSGFTLNIFRNAKLPKPHPIQFTDKNFVELTITSFFKYLNQKRLLPAIEYVSRDYADISGRNFNECTREIKTFIEIKNHQRISVDYSNLEVFINGNKASVKCGIKKHNPAADWTEVTFKLKKEKNIWKIVSFSGLFEALNKNEQESIEKENGFKGGKK